MILFMTVMPSNAKNQVKNAISECHFKEKGKPSQVPLVLHTELEVLHVRDVPDSGGTYGVDIK